MDLISFNYNDEIINQKQKKRINKKSSFIGEWCFSPKNIFSLDKKKKNFKNLSLEYKFKY